ncbi:glycosyltransferase [Pedobacter xixiisoli]|uniref:Glycosyltransferase involved in cell wall bisynthesis n=1 Tax=Pedobacter xixiisoli TaxID=1476464 RepID=A0A286AEL6_9SPHI|nr:glycosyltransferase [Pedobacter xixiisoli]SOD20340.1 Glycosyltransferase involved in cell wall bisynthesis [Pedobacter xixiisoli]
MKSILLYFNSLKPSGGIERVIVTVANKLCEQYKVTILVKGEPISFYKLDGRVRLESLGNELNFNMNSQLSRVFSAMKSVYKNSKSLKLYLKQNNFDYYYLAHPLNVLEFHFSKGVTTTNTVITEHGASTAYNLIYRKVKSWLYPKAKVYVVPTTKDTEYYKNLGFPAQYLPHFKSKLKYEKASLSEKIALNIGRFTDVKQQIALLRLWNSLVNVKQIKDWKLFLVGIGELENQFEEYIERNNLQNYVFLKPPKESVEEYYKQASLFLLTSKSEGFGMVLLEAISFGLPCVSYDCPSGPRDIIKNNENGYLVPPNDEVIFEQMVVNLLNNRELLEKMGNESLTISNNWNDEKLLEQWNIILN